MTMRRRRGVRRRARAPPSPARRARPPARTGPAAELVLAADQFVIRPAGRHEDHVRARVAGDEAWTVIAGYHWFTDWGRDTMISLEGLTLATGRIAEAGSILRMFAHHVRDGLVPNMFPEGANEGLYHTADATLWFFHAIDRYVRASRRRRTLAQLLPTLRTIIEHHMRGHAVRHRRRSRRRPARARARAGYQLTWMDAKAGDWVVTPRRGKAVEINALWYNALRLMERWLDARRRRRRRDADASARGSRARVVQRAGSGTRRPATCTTSSTASTATIRRAGRTSCSRSRCRTRCSRPSTGPRCSTSSSASCSRRSGCARSRRAHPDYKRNYHGDLLTRDAAYHQGTVWSWLIGPYVDARLRVRPDDRRRRTPRARRPGRAPRRELHRLRQRGVRRRAAVHAGRLRRAGVGRRRAAALLAPRRGRADCLETRAQNNSERRRRG